MILMIDEEKWRSNSVIDYLKKSHGYNVVLIDDIDDAIDYIGENRWQIEAFILDLMMPFGNSFSSEETEGGTLTGYRLFDKIRNEWKIPVPIIVYTALNKVELFNSLKKEARTAVLRKGSDSAYNIASMLRGFGIIPEPK